MMTDNQYDDIVQIERHARDAWPAAQRDSLQGWQLRFTYGITRRANSVWPNEATGNMLLHEKLNDAELFYAVYETPARFQISPAVQPVDLDIVLALRGYQRTAKTAVQTAKLDALFASSGRSLPVPGFSVDVTEAYSVEWFQSYSTIEQFASRAATVRSDIIRRIRARTGFALARFDGEPVAIGLGVVNHGWLGISCMATAPHMRRRGAATTILNALAGWAGAYGIRHVYLQVMVVNSAALALYQKCAFSTLYHYHYREKTL